MPVVPIAIVGAYAAMPKGRSWPKPGRPPIRVRYGRPLDPARGRDAPAALAADAAGRSPSCSTRTARRGGRRARRAASDETPRLAGPAGPGWLRTWEGSRPIRRQRQATDLASESRDPDGRRGPAARADRGGDPRVRPRRLLAARASSRSPPRCGIRKQTLLYYFPTKDALLEACLRRRASAWPRRSRRALEGKETYWDRAEAVIHAVFGLAEEWPEFPMFIREAGPPRRRRVRALRERARPAPQARGRLPAGRDGRRRDPQAGPGPAAVHALHGGRGLAHRGERAERRRRRRTRAGHRSAVASARWWPSSGARSSPPRSCASIWTYVRLVRLAAASARRVRTTFFTSPVGSGAPYSNLIVPLPVTRGPSSSRWASIARPLIGKRL